MSSRVLLAALAVACPAGSEALGQFGPPNASGPQSWESVNPRQRRTLRETAVQHAGAGARALVESSYGDDAALALLACSRPVAAQLAAFYASGGLARLPRQQELLRAIARPGCGNDVAVCVMRFAEALIDPDACDAFLASPLEFALGLKDLSAAAAARRQQRLAQPWPADLYLGSLGNRQAAAAAGVVGLATILIWAVRRNRTRDGPA